VSKPSENQKQIYSDADADEVLGRTHITGYQGWPPPEKIYNHLQVFAVFIDKHLPNGKILDLGCGDGSIARMVAEKNPKKTIVAVDLEAHPQWKMKNPKNLSFKTASIYKLPFAAGSFDAVVLKDVLHHLPDPEETMPKIAQLAKKKVLIIEANRYNPISYIRMVKVAKHEHFSRSKLRKVIGQPAEIYTYEAHVWPGSLEIPGKAVDRVFRTPVFKRLRNYNFALYKPKS